MGHLPEGHAVTDVTAVLSIIVVGIAAAGAIGRVALLMFRWGRRVEQALAFCESEMRFNAGSTQRDAIGRIEEHLGIEKGNK